MYKETTFKIGYQFISHQYKGKEIIDQVFGAISLMILFCIFILIVFLVQFLALYQRINIFIENKSLFYFNKT